MLRTSSCVLAVMCALLGAGPLFVQGGTVSSIDGKCVEARTDLANHAAALANSAKFMCCNTLGHLATFSNTTDLNLVRGMQNKTWIALSDQGHEGNYTWRAGPELGSHACSLSIIFPLSCACTLLLRIDAFAIVPDLGSLTANRKPF